MVHTFRKICTEWGLINSKGWDLIHKELITQVLESLLLPEGIAVVHIPGQQQSYSLETQRNRLADGVAKEMVLRSEAPNFHLTPTHPPPSITPVFKPWEEEQLAEVGASKTSEGKWLLPDRKEMLSKLILRKLLSYIEEVIGTHMPCVTLPKEFVDNEGIYTITKQGNESFITCRKVHKLVLKKTSPRWGRTCV